ncbi:MAG: preprotein translocase subunit SecE [Bacteroidetes bacterium]|nr:preprotein translocase subunit SecE [Bacteroidota bacterium]
MASFKTYLSESYNELVHKVSWPTWKELQSSAIIVLVAALLIALLVFLMDFVFGVHNMNNNSFWKGILGFIYKFMGQ